MPRCSLFAVALVGGLLSCGLLSCGFVRAEDKAPTAPGDASLARTRNTVKMLDDLYKTAVVLITEHYVNEENDLPAGTAAIALFQAMKSKGWHEVRLLDATGQPTNEDNVPNDDFEKQAVKKLLAGETFVDEVQNRDGVRYLRAATPVPVVMKKCVMCHDHYEQAKPGQAIGALSYTLKIE